MHSVSYLFITLLALAQAAHHDPENWRLAVSHDRFADRTSCRLSTRNGLIHYQPGAIGFRFRHRRDTLAAWHRIDEGAPVRWQDRYAALVAAGVSIDGPGLDDPTGGIVWIPQAELASAGTVAIRLIDRDRPRRFELAPIAPLLADATRQGCRFVEDGRH